jgi:hypothetical protein
MVKNKKGKTARNANGTFGSTKKAAITPETPPFIAVTPPAPSDNSSNESEVQSEPLVVVFDDPEDLDYVYDEADRDEEDALRNVQAMKQLKALNLEWKSFAKSQLYKCSCYRIVTTSFAHCKLQKSTEAAEKGYSKRSTNVPNSAMPKPSRTESHKGSVLPNPLSSKQLSGHISWRKSLRTPVFHL